MNTQHAFSDASLTEVEVFALSAELNLADGHSYLDTQELFGDVIKSLPELWKFAESMRVPEMEAYFRSVFANFYKLPGLLAQETFSICPTASNSIDIVGAWARTKGYRVGLVEPTFDNLALLLRRREVPVIPISEDAFFDNAKLTTAIDRSQIDCLFVVNPNNPTGKVLRPTDIRRIARLCYNLGKTLIIDSSFRFCHAELFDDYQILREERVSFISLEDTGKCWPTLDTKASILTSSPDVAPLLRTIYEEIYLCCSNLSLALIAAVIQRTAEIGGTRFMQSLMLKRRKLVEYALKDTDLRAVPSTGQSHMSVVWIDIGATKLSDLDLVTYFSRFGLAVLPGRYFFWNSHNEALSRVYVRLALLKPERVFRDGINILKLAADQLAYKLKNSEYSKLPALAQTSVSAS